MSIFLLHKTVPFLPYSTISEETPQQVLVCSLALAPTSRNITNPRNIPHGKKRVSTEKLLV